MNAQWKRLFTYFALLMVLLLIGFTAVTRALYAAFEGGNLSWPMALMFVLETLTTTGYGELLPFKSWPMTIWASFIILVGLGLVFVFLATVAAEWLKRRFQELPPEEAPAGMRDHIIICWYNPLVEALLAELTERHIPFLVIEPDRDSAADLHRKGIPVIAGDPTFAETLQAARVESARTIVAAGDDEANANVTLQAAVFVDAPVIATVGSEAHRKNLQYAGAERVVNPRAVLGEQLSRWALSALPRTLIAATSSVSGLQLMEVPIYPSSEFAGKTVGEVQFRQRAGVTILGLWHNGVFEMVKGPDTRLKENSVMTVVGTPQQVGQFRARCIASRSPVQRELPAAEGREPAERRPEEDSGTFLVAGFDEVGQKVVEILRSRGIPYRIIAEGPIPDEHGFKGDCTAEEVLIAAGIKEASTYIVTVDSDSEAVFTTLMARQLNPGLRIIVRVDAKRSVEKLYRAGADAVLALSEFGGRMLARALWREDWREVPDQEISFMEYEIGSRLAGKTIAEANIFRNTGCVVIGVEQDGTFAPNPSPHTRLTPGATIMLVGTRSHLDRFLHRYGARAVAKSE